MNICSGVSGNPTEQVPTAGNVYHKHCSVFSKQPVCGSCLRLKRQIQTRKPLRPTPNKSNMLRNLKKRVLRATAARQKHKKEIMALKEKLSKTSDQGVEEALSELPPMQRLAFMTAFKQLKAKSARGMRYTAEWILNCMMLRISSPRAYKLIIDMKMLPLPSPSRLTQILKGIL